MDLLPWMEQWHMLPAEGGVILCAVSGGRDSMCLLHYLHALSTQRSFTAAAAHLDHRMRPTAQRDADFVRDFCRARGIPFYLGRTPVYDMAKEWGVGVEEAGRRARYEFLEATARRIGAERIATAHHLRDQAETVLLNLLRGTGPEGLAGIPPVRGMYIRPLLNTDRGEIEAYLAEHGVGHVEDETNTDREYARNRLRLTLWPELEAINSAAAAHIAAAAAITRQENAYLDALAAEAMPAEGTELSCAALLSAPPALRGRMVRLLLARLPAGKKDVGAAHIEALVSLAESGGVLSLPGQMQAVCRDGVLTLSMAPQPLPELTLAEGRFDWGAYAVTVATAPPKRPAGEAVFCVFAPPGAALSVRPWHGSDRLTLPGSRGSRSLKRLFADAGIAPEQRDTLPVICVEGVPAAVYGVGAAQTLPERARREIPYYIIVTKER